MLSAFSNSFKIPELRKRILFTLGILILCRVAATIPCPGIDPRELSRVFEQLEQNSGAGGFVQMFNLFTGGALQRFAVAALGIMPYISASIVMSLLAPVLPALERIQREGESGRQKINQYTRYLTLVICVVQGLALARTMQNPGGMLGINAGSVVADDSALFPITTVIFLTCGTLILMWLGEQITDRGIGNGASLIITIGILDRMPSAVYSVWTLAMNQGTGTQTFSWIHVILLCALFVGVVACTVMLTVGVRKIPIQYARTTAGGRGGMGAAKTSYFPLKVNYASVMPIIFASALLMFPPMILSYIPALARHSSWFAYGSTPYMICYGILIITFSFFWVQNQFNPIRIADDLKRQGAYIPGIRPGKPTSEYLDRTMTRVTLAGAVFLTALALLPMIINRQMALQPQIAQFFGGASVLIICGVMLDTMNQVESHLLMHHYDGFLNKGRLRGRRG